MRPSHQRAVLMDSADQSQWPTTTVRRSLFRPVTTINQQQQTPPPPPATTSTILSVRTDSIDSMFTFHLVNCISLCFKQSPTNRSQGKGAIQSVGSTPNHCVSTKIRKTPISWMTSWTSMKTNAITLPPFGRARSSASRSSACHLRSKKCNTFDLC